MDYLILLIIISFLWICRNLVSLLLRQNVSKLPPGPPRLPIIGNFLDLGIKPHHSLAKLSKTYGPIMSLKLGCLTTVVVTSPDLARQFLHVHGQETSGRWVPDAQHAFDHYKFSVVFLPADCHWRRLRNLCKVFVFSAKRLELSQGLRREKVQGLLDYVAECCEHGLEVNIGLIGFITSLNIISSTLYSTDLAGYSSKESQEFKERIRNAAEETGRPNLADYLPMLKWLDPQGVRRRSIISYGKILDHFQGILEQRFQCHKTSPPSSSIDDDGDVLDALLNSSQHEIGFKLTKNDIEHLFLDLFVAGTDTSSTTLEWAMTELLRSPTAMDKAKSELRELIGDGKMMQESDIPNLPYLQAVVKETLRLHPVAPLVINKSVANFEVSSFTIPKDSQVLVNVWAISRDPSIWSNPESFNPERFLQGSSIDFRGQHFEYLPFGGGWRICPGIPLATRLVPLMLGSLIHSYHWRLPMGMKPEDIDMDDKFGISVQKTVPLRAIPQHNGKCQENSTQALY